MFYDKPTTCSMRMVLSAFARLPWVPEFSRSWRPGAEIMGGLASSPPSPVISAPAVWERETSGTQRIARSLRSLYQLLKHANFTVYFVLYSACFFVFAYSADYETVDFHHCHRLYLNYPKTPYVQNTHVIWKRQRLKKFLWNYYCWLVSVSTSTNVIEYARVCSLMLNHPNECKGWSRCGTETEPKCHPLQAKTSQKCPPLLSKNSVWWQAQ